MMNETFMPVVARCSRSADALEYTRPSLYVGFKEPWPDLMNERTFPNIAALLFPD